MENEFDCTLIKLGTYGDDECAGIFAKCKANKDASPDGCAKRSCANYAGADNQACLDKDSTCTNTTETDTPC